MATFHVIYLVTEALCLFYSLSVYLRHKRPRGVRPHFLWLLTTAAVQAAIAGQEWRVLGDLPVVLDPRQALLLGFMVFGSFMIPLTLLFAILRPKPNSKRFEV